MKLIEFNHQMLTFGTWSVLGLATVIQMYHTKFDDNYLFAVKDLGFIHLKLVLADLMYVYYCTHVIVSQEHLCQNQMIQKQILFACL